MNIIPSSLTVRDGLNLTPIFHCQRRWLQSFIIIETAHCETLSDIPVRHNHCSKNWYIGHLYKWRWPHFLPPSGQQTSVFKNMIYNREAWSATSGGLLCISCIPTTTWHYLKLKLHPINSLLWEMGAVLSRGQER